MGPSKTATANQIIFYLKICFTHHTLETYI